MARPKRSGLQLIEDGFSDLDLNSQSRMLETLAQLHRWCKRERSRPTPEPYRSDSAYQSLPTEWLAAPDPALQQRIAGDTTPESHEH